MARPRRPRSNFGFLRYLDPFVWYAAGAVLVVLVLLLLSSGAATRSVSRAVEVDELPSDDIVTFLLDDFLSSSARPAETVPPPSGGALLTVLQPQRHVVRRGDTISSIAAKHSVREDTVISYNGITDVRKLAVGAELLIPSINGTPIEGVLHVVRRSETLGGIAARYGVPLNPILDVNDLESHLIRPGELLFIPGGKMAAIDLRRAKGTLFIKPTVGAFTSGFGMRNDPFTGVRQMHYGVDWANEVGTAVWASNDGVVKYTGESRVYGRYVVIEHVSGYQSLYAHLDNWTVRNNERVSQGQKVGEMGNSGRSTGPHLHFSIYWNGKPIDPVTFIY